MRLSHLLCSPLFILVGILWFAPETQAQTAAIQGTVLDTRNQPVSEASVILEQPDDGERVTGTRTNAGGAFSLEGMPAGRYTLRVSAVSYETVKKVVDLRGNAQRTLSVQLAKTQYGLDDIVVRAPRSRETMGGLASSVSILDTETLERQQSITSDLGDMLAQKVPGLAPSSASLGTFGQGMRGRTPLIMIDGVPQNTPLRDVHRVLRTVSPAVIDRVEVVRGGSALYGHGATGGAINLITKDPSPSLEATTEVGIRSSTADLQESFTGRLHQSVAGRAGGFGYVVGGSYERRGQFYDGKKQLIPQDPYGRGGRAGATEISLFGKVDRPLADAQRLAATVSYYSILQSMEYGREPGTFGKTPTAATSEATFPGDDPGTQNLVGRLQYEHSDLLGSTLRVQGYAQDYLTRFAYREGDVPGVGEPFPGGGQSFVESTKLGARADVTMPLPPLGSDWKREVTWGVDALWDRTAQPLENGRTYVPPMTQTSVAPFAQVRFSLNDRLTLRGGVRHEAFSLRVDDFTTLFEENNVAGGTLTYRETVVNAGAVYSVTEPVEVFLSFDQGFSVSDVGRLLRSTSAASVSQIQPEAKTVNSYEGGTRFDMSIIDLSVTGFYNTSQLGSRYGAPTDLSLIQAPERVYGAEVTTDVQLLELVEIGGTFTWQEGRRDPNADGIYESYLPGTRISPSKTTGYVKVESGGRWSGYLQVLHVGARDRFDDESYGHGRINSYTLVDLSGRVSVGPGDLRIGGKNLLGTYYFPVRSQFSNVNSEYTPGRGRTVSLTYTVTW